MKLSLVVASVERTQELTLLLGSLAMQTYRDFEVILVDQNSDDRLAPIVAQYRSQLPLRHLRSAVRNCSRARNLGLEAAIGEVVGFPDDDCCFQRDSVERVMEHFAREPGLAVLSGNSVSATGAMVNGRWSAQSCAITAKTVWTTVIGFALWTRTEAARAVGGFDPRIGPGTYWGSGEEPDFVLRLMRRGYRGYYDASIGILHPDKTLTSQAIGRAFQYGAGMGRVLRKHSIALSIALPYFVRPVGGMLLSLLRGQRSHAGYYWATLRGRLRGYFAKPDPEPWAAEPVAPMPWLAPEGSEVGPGSPRR